MDPNVTSSSANIQHVTKTSSDELLRKFAQVDDEDDGFESKKEHPARVSRRSKRRRTSRREEGDACESPSHYSGAALVERRSLLAPVARKSTFLRQLGIDGAGKSHLRIRNIKNKSVLTAIQKRWHKTMEGASKLLLEKYYGRHRRLINDVV